MIRKPKYCKLPKKTCEYITNKYGEKFYTNCDTCELNQRFTKRKSGDFEAYITDNLTDKEYGYNIDNMLGLLNTLNNANLKLQEENIGIQNKVWRLLNWLSDVEKVITKEQVKEWWNNEMINDD